MSDVCMLSEAGGPAVSVGLRCKISPFIRDMQWHNRACEHRVRTREKKELKISKKAAYRSVLRVSDGGEKSP